MTTWRKLIREAMRASRDHGTADRDGNSMRQDRPADPGPIIACTLTEAELDEPFDGGLGCAMGKPFTAWTLARVYFPTEYDGAEGVGSAPRNPCNEWTKHQG